MEIWWFIKIYNIIITYTSANTKFVSFETDENVIYKHLKNKNNENVGCYFEILESDEIDLSNIELADDIAFFDHFFERDAEKTQLVPVYPANLPENIEAEWANRDSVLNEIVSVIWIISLKLSDENNDFICK